MSLIFLFKWPKICEIVGAIMKNIFSTEKKKRVLFGRNPPLGGGVHSGLYHIVEKSFKSLLDKWSPCYCKLVSQAYAWIYKKEPRDWIQHLVILTKFYLFFPSYLSLCSRLLMPAKNQYMVKTLPRVSLAKKNTHTHTQYHKI